MSTIKKDFLAMASHDPSVLTGRHCTGEDVRRLAALAGIPPRRARAAFSRMLFRRTTYLMKSLDPEFEPKADVRELARKELEYRALLKTDPAAAKRLKEKPPPQPPTPAPTKAVKPAQKQPSRLRRYSFS